MDLERKTAYMTLMDIETKQAYSNIALNSAIEREKPLSPAFVRELVYGVLENRLLLDYMISQLVPKGVKSIKSDALNILRMGIYQIRFMDSVPEYAAVDESVKLAKRYAKGRDGFVNAVLHSYITKKDTIRLPDEEDTVSYLSVRYSYAPWIVKMWMEEYGRERTEKILNAGNSTPDMTIRVNPLKTDRETLAKMLKDEGFSVKNGSVSKRALRVSGSGLLATEMYKKGLFSVQDEASIMAAEILGAEEGETIIDVCAAPGGKTLASAESMGNKGLIYASDIYERKLAQINSESERLGITNIMTRAHDASVTDTEIIFSADRVLVDAPCSGLGVIRRKPEIKYKEYDDDMKMLPEKQLAILEASSMYVKPGGILVYSTCTINPHENREVIERFLKDNRWFSTEKEIQLLPDKDDTDGFYICRMRKAGITG